MGFIAWLGPTSFAQLGVKAWWTPLVPAALVLGFTWWLARKEKEAERAEAMAELAAAPSASASHPASP